MQVDYGSRDKDFIDCVDYIRKSLVKLADLPANEFTCILMQGAGTMGVESVIGTTVPRDGKMLVCTNGAYGDRIGMIAKTLGINAVSFFYYTNINLLLLGMSNGKLIVKLNRLKLNSAFG